MGLVAAGIFRGVGEFIKGRGRQFVPFKLRGS